MPVEISNEVWLIVATVFGGIGATLVLIVSQCVKNALTKKRIKKHLRREIKFNIAQIQKHILDPLTDLKENYIKTDRQGQFHHFFNLKRSSIIYVNLINTGVIYDYLDDEQLIKIDNLHSEQLDFLNKKIDEIRNNDCTKSHSADLIDHFINRYNDIKDNLSNVLDAIK